MATEDLGSARGKVEIDVSPALRNLAQLRRQTAQASGSLNSFGRASITAGQGMVGVGGAVVGVFALAIKKTAELEKQLSFIKGITGETEDGMEAIRQKVIELGQSSAYTAQEVASGFTELSKAGATTKELVGGMGEAMITLGQASDISLDKAASTLVSISSTFGIAVTQSSHIADIIQGAANASIASVEDLSVSMKYAGGVAANLGISLEDTATALSILANAGIRGSTAGTSLRRILLQLTPRTDKAKAAMQELGIITADGANKFYDAAGRAKSLAEITEILRTSTMKLTPELRQKAFATIFGDRAINSAIALSKGGSEAFDEMYRKVGNVKAADVAKERLNNLAGAFEILKGSIDSALIKAGAPAQKPLKQLVELITKVVNAFTNLSPGTQELIIKLVLLGAAFLLIVGSMFIFLGLALRAYAILVQLNALTGGRLLKGLKALRTAILAVNAAFWANPVAIVIAALILLGIALFVLYKKSDRFRAIVDKAFRGVAKAAKFLLDFVKKNWKMLVVMFLFPFTIIPILLYKFRGVISKIFIAIFNFLLKVAKAALDKLVSFFVALPGWIAGALTSIVGALASFVAEIPRWLGLAIGFLIGFYIRMWVETVKGIFRFGKALMTFFINLPGNLWRLLVLAFQRIVQFYAWLFNKAKSGGASFANALLGFFRALPGNIWSLLKLVMQKIIDFGIWFVQKAINLGKDFSKWILDGIKGMPGKVKDILGQVIEAFKGVVKQAFNAAKDFAGGLWDGFKKGLGINSPSFIEKHMFQMTDTADTQTEKLRNQIRTLQGLGTTLPPVPSQSPTARNAASAAGRAAAMRDAAASSQQQSNGPLVEVHNHNPVAEKGSVSTTKSVTRLAALGVLK